jgi:hypothetical protein
MYELLQNGLPVSDIVGGELIWPASTCTRPIATEEVERLAKALGKPIDEKSVVWLSRSIDAVVRFSSPPTARECRDHFLKIVHGGRRWLEHIDQCPSRPLLASTEQLTLLREHVSTFCDQLALTAQKLESVSKAGHPTTPIARMAFLDNMIGIAKRSKVLPSTPSRAPRKPGSTGRPPPFFCFVREALSVAKDVINSSSLKQEQKKAALKVLYVQSDQALGKLLEGLRGRIGGYQEGADGALVEWTTNPGATALRRGEEESPA